ncbi:MAG: ATP synthase F1 subunit epsilon [Ignavibacteriales bacterium CG12_big_fil_rev_8_21_14_0_65_30_8]|nr:MAG: ATP synthase F1 subunit epsilon [Ignavibacteriales bacterium CG12_big_fil_rev_8_21_14_0_65_30_8]
MAELKLEITTPEKIIFEEEIVSVTVPGSKGGFEVLVNHAPIISTIEIGEIKVVTKNNSIKFFATSGGTIEVENNSVLILSDAIELVEEIDIDRAKDAKARAEKRFFDKEKKEIDMIRAKAALKRAENRIKVAEMRLTAKA